MCSLHNISSPIIITCFVFGYYPTITLYFRHNTSKLETFQTREWNNTDGTRNKTITATAEPSDFPHTCVAADIPGSGNGEHVTSIFLHSAPDVTTTNTILTERPGRTDDWITSKFMHIACIFTTKGKCSFHLKLFCIKLLPVSSWLLCGVKFIDDNIFKMIQSGFTTNNTISDEGPLNKLMIPTYTKLLFSYFLLEEQDTWGFFFLS